MRKAGPRSTPLQNYGSRAAPVVFYDFEVPMLAGRELRGEILDRRRELLEKRVLPKLAKRVRYLAPLNAPLPDLIASVKAQGFEGLVAKRRNSKYESGLRNGEWQKMCVNGDMGW